MVSESCAITWVPVNILDETAPFILRHHDSLLLTAREETTPGDAVVTLAIATPSGATETFVTTAAAPFEYCFSEAGVYQIAASLSGNGNAPVSKTLQVQARAVSLSEGPLVTFAGNYNAPLAVTVGSGPIAMSADAGISGVPASVSASTTLSIKSTGSTVGRIVARAGASSGAILGTVAVEPQRTLLRPSDWGSAPAVMTLPNGDSIVKITLICEELPDGWYVEASMYAHATYFMDGSQAKRFTKDDFNGGVLDIYILGKAGDSGVCHYITLYDNQGRAVLSC